MSRLKRANREAVSRYEEDGDFLVCRKELTRGEMMKLFRVFPQQSEESKPDLEAIATFMEEFFDIVVRDWSLEDEEGNKILPTVEAYRDLEAAGGIWVDQQLQKHIKEVMGTKDQDIEGEVTG